MTKADMPDRNLVREYLLGRLDGNEKLEESLSEQVFFDNEVSDMVCSVEDEMIEEYLDGTLDNAEVKDLESYFLRPPQRQERLRVARLLRQHFENTRSELIQIQPRFDPRPAPGVIQYFAGSYSRFAFAALLVFLAALLSTYLYRVHTHEASLRAELVQLRTRPASPPLTAQTSPSNIVTLTLASGVSRSEANAIPSVQLTPAAHRLVVDIALQDGASVAYDVAVSHQVSKVRVWSARLLPIVSPAGYARLVFDVETQAMEPGLYLFTVVPSTPGLSTPQTFKVEIKTAH